MRQQDYFDLSSGHQNELNNIRGLPDTRAAMYQTSEASTLSTPSIHKFYYDRDIVDVGYTPTNDAYRPKYYNQSIKQPQGAYSTVQNYNTYNIGNTIQPATYDNTYQNSTVQPLNYSVVQPVQHDSYNSGVGQVTYNSGYQAAGYH